MVKNVGREITIFTNMRTLLKPNPGNIQAWPQSLFLPRLPGSKVQTPAANIDLSNLPVDSEVHVKDLLNALFTRQRNKTNTECEHTDRKHYAKGMCSWCYHKYGRVKKSWACPHEDKVMYAQGMCQSCYLHRYHKNKRERRSSRHLV